MHMAIIHEAFYLFFSWGEEEISVYQCAAGSSEIEKSLGEQFERREVMGQRVGDRYVRALFVFVPTVRR